MVFVILKALHRTYDELDSKFYSDDGSFKVTLYNLNYRQTIEKNRPSKMKKQVLKPKNRPSKACRWGLKSVLRLGKTF